MALGMIPQLDRQTSTYGASTNTFNNSVMISYVFTSGKCRFINTQTILERQFQFQLCTEVLPNCGSIDQTYYCEINLLFASSHECSEYLMRVISESCTRIFPMATLTDS